MPGRKRTPGERIAMLEAKIEKKREYIAKCQTEIREYQAQIDEIRRPTAKVNMRSVLTLAKKAGYTPQHLMEQLNLNIDDLNTGNE